jgi:hypothetical protein
MYGKCGQFSRHSFIWHWCDSSTPRPHDLFTFYSMCIFMTKLVQSKMNYNQIYLFFLRNMTELCIFHYGETN